MSWTLKIDALEVCLISFALFTSCADAMLVDTLVQQNPPSISFQGRRQQHFTRPHAGMQENTQSVQQNSRHMQAGQSQQDVTAEENLERHQLGLSGM